MVPASNTHAGELERGMLLNGITLVGATVQGIRQVGDTLRPRFIEGKPPDVLLNAGVGSFDLSALLAEDQRVVLVPFVWLVVTSLFD